MTHPICTMESFLPSLNGFERVWVMLLLLGMLWKTSVLHDASATFTTCLSHLSHHTTPCILTIHTVRRLLLPIQRTHPYKQSTTKLYLSSEFHCDCIHFRMRAAILSCICLHLLAQAAVCGECALHRNAQDNAMHWYAQHPPRHEYKAVYEQTRWDSCLTHAERSLRLTATDSIK